MLFSDITPFIRFAHILDLTATSFYAGVIPLDSRLFFVREGFGEIIADGKTYHLKKADVLIINAGIPYKLCTPESEISYIAINFDYDKTAAHKNLPVPPVNINDFLPELLLNPVRFENLQGLSSVLFIQNLPIIQKRLLSIVNEYTLQLVHFQEKISATLSECLIDCVRAESLIPQEFESQTTGQIIHYVHENYTEPLTNASIASVFHYHPNYISQLIKSVTGMPLHKYVINVRLNKALSLLQNTDLSLNEVALACGFCDSAYFSRYFKKQYKIIPSKFRKV